MIRPDAPLLHGAEHRLDQQDRAFDEEFQLIEAGPQVSSSILMKGCGPVALNHQMSMGPNAFRTWATRSATCLSSRTSALNASAVPPLLRNALHLTPCGGSAGPVATPQTVGGMSAC